jgi:hypothetical protein
MLLNPLPLNEYSEIPVVGKESEIPRAIEYHTNHREIRFPLSLRLEIYW